MRIIFAIIILIGVVGNTAPAKAQFAPQIFHIEGRSMVPFGFVPGDVVRTVTQDVKVGDVVAFSCALASCEGSYIKKVTHTDGQCYWVEGRGDHWMEEDGQEKYSRDSQSEFGWLCGKEISIHGVVEHV